MQEPDGCRFGCPVIYVLPYLALGGTEYHVLHLVQAIGWAVPPAVVAPEGPLAGELERAGARVFPFVDPTGRWRQGLKSFRRALEQAAACLRQGSAPGRPVLVRVHGAAELLALARRWLPGPPGQARFLFTSHGYFGRGAAASYRLAAWVLRRTRTPVIAVSQQEAGRLVRAGLAPHQVRRIPNGVPDPLACPAEPWPFGAGRPRVLSVGRLVEQKGMLPLVEAFERILPDFPEARLVIVGSGPLEGRLRRRIAGSPRLSARVELAGAVEQAWRFMRQADLFCLASLDEALPLTVVEALGSGCAVVATRAGGIPEVVQHGTSGLLVPPNDVEALATALRRVLADHDLRRRLARAGRRRFEEEFTVQAMAARTVALYEELTRPAASAPGRPLPHPVAGDEPGPCLARS